MTIIRRDTAMLDWESEFYEYPIKRINRFSVFSLGYFIKKNNKRPSKRFFTFLYHVFCSENPVDDRLCWLYDLRLLSV